MLDDGNCSNESGTSVTVVLIRIKGKVLKFNNNNGHVQNLRGKYSNFTFDYKILLLCIMIYYSQLKIFKYQSWRYKQDANNVI